MAVIEQIRAAEVALVPAGTADLAVLAALYAQMYEAHDCRIAPDTATRKLARMLAAPGQRALLFSHGGLTLGFAIWADLGDHVFIRDYLIDAAHRGHGLGAALFARLRAEALPPGLPVRLEASADPARRFWEAQGLAAWSSGMRSDAIEEHP